MNNDHLFKLVDPDLAIWTIRAFYIFAGYAILVVRLIPDFRHRFLEYGARSDKSKQKSSHQSALPQWFRIQVDPVLDLLANITVPHGWFTHFYVCSTVCSAYWLVCSKNLFHCYHAGFRQNMFGSWEYRTLICMVLLQVQGLRRLYECVVIAKSSKSRMWIGHYFIGVAFYLVTNVAIWIEPVLEGNPENCNLHHSLWEPDNLRNLIRVAVCVPMFFYYSWKQFQVHKYLASLKKYRVPDHPIYIDTNLVCPHYAFEIYIYLCFTILTARETRILNITVLCAMFFVAINLGVTADLTKKWQMQKFPKQRPEIAGRRRMLGSIW